MSEDQRSSEALDALEHASVLWLVGEGPFAGVVTAACAVLVCGGDGDSLAALAGESPREPVYPGDMDEAIHQALAEQGRPLPARHSEAALERALVAVARRVVQGDLPAHEAACWAHPVIGHTGPDLGQPLVELDDRYDTLEYSDDTAESLDREALELCRTIAGSCGSPRQPR